MADARAGLPVSPFLLHGVTGSGKTEVYLQAVEATLRQGRQAIVLVPEISLTPQTVNRFLARFPGQVGFAHSRLSDGERYDTWRRARAGQIGVVVGARDRAVHPIPSPGFGRAGRVPRQLVLPERSALLPRRGSRPGLCPHHQRRLPAGSATPDITQTYQAAQGRWRYLRLPARILAHQQEVEAHTRQLGIPSHYRPLEEKVAAIELPPVTTVDMRQELKRATALCSAARCKAAWRRWWSVDSKRSYS